MRRRTYDYVVQRIGPFTKAISTNETMYLAVSMPPRISDYCCNHSGGGVLHHEGLAG